MGQAYQMGAPGRFLGYPNMAGAYCLLLGPLGALYGLPVGPLLYQLMCDWFIVIMFCLCAISSPNEGEMQPEMRMYARGQ